MFQIVILVVIILIVLGLSYFLLRTISENDSPTVSEEIHSAREILAKDAQLHRLLLIEVLSQRSTAQSATAQSATYQKMVQGMKILGQSLAGTGHVAIAQLMEQRTKILRDYYHSLRSQPVNQETPALNLQRIAHLISKQGREVPYQRLYNLLSIYDHELINQARSYATDQYEISLTSHYSSVNIAHHLGEEFGTVIIQGQNITQT